jgi:hypothetical protein
MHFLRFGSQRGQEKHEISSARTAAAMCKHCVVKMEIGASQLSLDKGSGATQSSSCPSKVSDSSQNEMLGAQLEQITAMVSSARRDDVSEATFQASKEKPAKSRFLF